ncbi:hypothetical protein ILYODFUR_029727, partial [Ilyodon furcidens]
PVFLNLLQWPQSLSVLPPTTKPPDLMGIADLRVHTLLYIHLSPPSSPRHPLLSLLPHPTLLPSLHILAPLLLWSLTRPLHPLPPTFLSWFRLSHQCITHRSTSTPLRMRVRWPWGKGGACWRVREEHCHSLMG